MRAASNRLSDGRRIQPLPRPILGQNQYWIACDAVPIQHVGYPSPRRHTSNPIPSQIGHLQHLGHWDSVDHLNATTVVRVHVHHFEVHGHLPQRGQNALPEHRCNRHSIEPVVINDSDPEPPQR